MTRAERTLADATRRLLETLRQEERAYPYIPMMDFARTGILPLAVEAGPNAATALARLNAFKRAYAACPNAAAVYRSVVAQEELIG